MSMETYSYTLRANDEKAPPNLRSGVCCFWCDHSAVTIHGLYCNQYETDVNEIDLCNDFVSGQTEDVTDDN